MTIQIGQIITDGTATFIVDDVTDGRKPGDIIFHHVLRPGYIKANGAAIAAEDYPRLFKYVQDNNLLVTEAEWQASMSGMYVYDDTAKTLRLPDLRAMFLRALDDGRGVDVNRLLGTKQGDMVRAHNHTYLNPSQSRWGGYGIQHENDNDAGHNGTTYTGTSGGNETRPHNIALIAQIKY